MALTDKLTAIANAIRAKTGGSSTLTLPQMAQAIDALPTGGTLIPKTITENGVYNAADDNADGYDVVTVNVDNFDMSVINNQIKMVIEVDDSDLSFWTRFGQTANSTVTVDWGDGTQDVYIENSYKVLDYATQRKHQYQKAGRYLVTETIENGTLSVGSINGYSTLSEGSISSSNKNAKDAVRRMYNSKVKELSLGNSITVNTGFLQIPFVIMHNDFNFSFQGSETDYITIKEGTSTIGAYWFSNSAAYSIKIPSSVNTIDNNAFDGCQVRIIDFTDMELTEQGELPFSIFAVNVFRGSDSTILLFKTQEIAEVAKNTTNLSVYASRIKYEGEEI